MRHLPPAEADAVFEDGLVRVAVRAKEIEATSGTPEIASSVGYKVSVVIRTRVAERLQQP